MGEYALLTEVYGSDFKTKKKSKKNKKESRNRIIEPDEMDRVLLNEQTVSPEVKVRQLNNIEPNDEVQVNYKEYFQNYPSENKESKSYLNDPEYQDFLRYKKEKQLMQNVNKTRYTQNEQFNELMLYIFTGFFILMLFDNIYKLGKKSY